MSEMPKRLIDTAIDAARALPEPVQDALAEEILARIGELGESRLTPLQRDEVKRRLSEPARYADAADAREFFARHGVAE